MCRGFLLYKFKNYFAGDFPGGFFWALFPTKMRIKNPATKSAKKSCGPQKKAAKKSVLPKTNPNNFESIVAKETLEFFDKINPPTVKRVLNCTVHRSLLWAQLCSTLMLGRSLALILT